MTYELKLAGNGQVVTWEGESAEDAARRYVDHRACLGDRNAVVIAWRTPPHGLFVGVPRYWRSE